MKDLAFVTNIVKEVKPSAELFIHDSFQGVINDVLNQNIKPDAAIIDMQIFKMVGQERKQEGPDVKHGVEMAVRLRAIGLPDECILVLTALPQNVEMQLREAGYPKIKVIPKDTHPTKRRSLIEDFLARLPLGNSPV